MESGEEGRRMREGRKREKDEKREETGRRQGGDGEKQFLLGNLENSSGSFSRSSRSYLYESTRTTALLGLWCPLTKIQLRSQHPSTSEYHESPPKKDRYKQAQNAKTTIILTIQCPDTDEHQQASKPSRKT